MRPLTENCWLETASLSHVQRDTGLRGPVQEVFTLNALKLEHSLLRALVEVRRGLGVMARGERKRSISIARLSRRIYRHASWYAVIPLMLPKCQLKIRQYMEAQELLLANKGTQERVLEPQLLAVGRPPKLN